MKVSNLTIFFIWFDSKAENTSLTVVMTLYAILATIGAVLGLYLPETKDREIPDTVEEAENLDNYGIKNRKLIGK